MIKITSRFKTIIVVILGMWMLTSTAKAQDNGAGHKIVFQLTDNDTRSHKALVGQLYNLTKGWPKAQVEVVVHSAGITFLQATETQFAGQIRELAGKGIAFKACENTLRSKAISKEEILDSASFVPMGIGEVVLKQEQGWSYIKAGL